MDKPAPDLRWRLYASAVVVLVVGLCAAAVIYITAGDDDDVSDAYQVVIVNGKVYPISPAQSKVYVHQLEQFGGKAAVLFDELGRWFAGLWRGKSLAFTVGWISVFVSFALLLLARLAPPDSDERHPDGRA